MATSLFFSRITIFTSYAERALAIIPPTTPAPMIATSNILHPPEFQNHSSSLYKKNLKLSRIAVKLTKVSKKEAKCATMRGLREGICRKSRGGLDFSFLPWYNDKNVLL
jgi:hypothetical protein